MAAWVAGFFGHRASWKTGQANYPVFAENHFHPTQMPESFVGIGFQLSRKWYPDNRNRAISALKFAFP